MSARFSSWFFLRSYVAIAVAILLIALALDGIMVWLTPEQQTTNAMIYGPDLLLLDALLGEHAAQENLTGAFAALRPQLEQTVGVPVALYELRDFANQAELLTALRSQDVVSMFDSDGGELLYHQNPDSGFILALGPLTTAMTSDGYGETLVIIVYYVLVAVILFLWIRPFYRDLSALRLASSQFGRDDFSARVEVEPGSSIRPVADSFNKMADRIQYLVTAHRDLTNAVSHELRTPLARFKFSLEILHKTKEPEKKADYLASMKTDVQELEELIDEMLTYAKLGEENLQFAQTEVPLDNWLEQQVSQYKDGDVPILFQFYTIKAGDSTKVNCNPDMIARALHNVLRNCRRYADSAIRVSAELSEQFARIRICDDGPGIPNDMHETVFEPFSRLDTSRDRQSGGYGLGLAIAKRALQRHRGTIHVENNTPRGACFVLQWPRTTG